MSPVPQVLWLLVAPQSGAGIAAGSTLVFALSLGEYAVARMAFTTREHLGD